MRSQWYFKLSVCVYILISNSVLGQTLPTRSLFTMNTGKNGTVAIDTSIRSFVLGRPLEPNDDFGVFANGIEPGKKMSLHLLLNTDYTEQFTYRRGDGTNMVDNIYALNAFTATISQLFVKVKVFLQGPYNSGEMTTALNTAGIIPLSSSTAYNTTTFGYIGKTVGAIPNLNVIDWILVELRTGTASSTKVETQAAFLLKDGSVVDVDGSSDVPFYIATAGDYYIVIRHRNHLAIMSAATVTLPNASVYDFTTALTQSYGTNPTVDVSGVGTAYAMWSGDVNGDGTLKYCGPNNDRGLILKRVGGIFNAIYFGYFQEDTNMDGKVKYNGAGNDRAAIMYNIGGTIWTGIKVTQVPN